MWTEARPPCWPGLSPSLSACGHGVDKRARLGTAPPSAAASPARPHAVPAMSHSLSPRDQTFRTSGLVVDARSLLHQAADLVAGVHHGSVITAGKRLGDPAQRKAFGQRLRKRRESSRLLTDRLDEVVGELLAG